MDERNVNIIGMCANLFRFAIILEYQKEIGESLSLLDDYNGKS